MENLLPFLDTYSIICLAKAHKPVQDIIVGKTVWNQMIRQVCQGYMRMDPRYSYDYFDQEKEFEQMKIQVDKNILDDVIFVGCCMGFDHYHKSNIPQE